MKLRQWTITRLSHPDTVECRHCRPKIMRPPESWSLLPPQFASTSNDGQPRPLARVESCLPLPFHLVILALRDSLPIVDSLVNSRGQWQQAAISSFFPSSWATTCVHAGDQFVDGFVSYQIAAPMSCVSTLVSFLPCPLFSLLIPGRWRATMHKDHPAFTRPRRHFCLSLGL